MSGAFVGLLDFVVQAGAEAVMFEVVVVVQRSRRSLGEALGLGVELEVL